ncbi:hypothetical protein TELCIR_17730, partial [Teladorsagia circumcincta]
LVLGLRGAIIHCRSEINQRGVQHFQNNQNESNNTNNANTNKSNSSNEVPGFGANSSIHELFGKMVWKKMEGIRDDAVIDRLQNRIMNMIHEALAQQNEAANGSGGSNQNSSGKNDQSGSFRSY